MNTSDLIDKKICELDFGDYKPNTNTIITNACAAHNVITVRDLLRVKLSEIAHWKTIGGKTFDLLLKFLEKNSLLVTVEEAYIQTLKNMEKEKEENMENKSSDIWEERLFKTAQKVMLLRIRQTLETSPIETPDYGRIADESVRAAGALNEKLRESTSTET